MLKNGQQNLRGWLLNGLGLKSPGKDLSSKGWGWGLDNDMISRIISHGHLSKRYPLYSYYLVMG